jgi:AcrR family transcriptional regulator
MAKPTKSARKTRAYHHGDLKAALVEHAIELLRSEGPEGLTLRAVARAAGVSQAAPYRHFADRGELVAAVAQEGFDRMQAAMHARAEQGGEGMKGVAIAYVEFAHRNPAQYRVMFGPELARSEVQSARETGRAVLGFVAQGIEQLQKAGAIGPGKPWSIAISTWAMLHGVVMLSLDGIAADVMPPLDELIEDATRILMFGMVGPRRG